MNNKIALIIFTPNKPTPFQKKQWQYRVNATQGASNLIVFDEALDSKEQFIAEILNSNDDLISSGFQFKRNEFKKIILVTNDALPIGDFQDLFKLNNANYFVKDHTIRTSPILVINSCSNNDWKPFPPQLVFSLHHMLAGKFIISRMFRLLTSFSVNPSKISICCINGTRDTFEELIFDDDNRMISFASGRRLQWSDFYSRGIKSLIQNFFKTVALAKISQNF